jgi:hypothetical protein
MARRNEFQIQLEGMPELKRALESQHPKMDMAVKQAIYGAALEIARDANDLVPVDTGNLRSSQNVQYKKGLEGHEVTVSYGDTATAYALVQHERLDFWHPPKPPNKSVVGGRQGTGPVLPGSGRGAKYLEIPFMKEVSEYPQKLVQRIRVAFHGLGE